MGYLDAIMALIGVITGLIVIFTPEGRNALGTLLKNVVGGALDVAAPLVEDLSATLITVINSISSAAQDQGPKIAAAVSDPLTLLTQHAYDAVINSLVSSGPVSPSDGIVNGAHALGDAAAFGLASFAATAAFESIFPEKLNTLNGIGPMLATLAGFEEVTKAAFAPTLWAAVELPSRYHAQSVFRSFQPDPRTAEIAFGRGFITRAQFLELLGYAGLFPTWETAYEQLAYRPVQPRMLANAYIDAPLPMAELAAMLRDNAYSPAHVDTIMDALVYNSTKNLRAQYVNEALTAFSDGVMERSELDQVFSDVGWSTTAQHYATQTALLKMRVKLAQEAKQQVVPEIAAGLIDQINGQMQLESAGFTSNQAELYTQFAATKAAIHARTLELRAEARENALRTRDLVKVAISNFQNGTLGATELGAAIIAAGLPPDIAAATVLYETAKQNGHTVVVYGKRLKPVDAAGLKDQVAAILQQLKQKLLTVDQARTQLHERGIDPGEQNAILAKAAASIVKTPGPDVLLSPLTGSAE